MPIIVPLSCVAGIVYVSRRIAFNCSFAQLRFAKLKVSQILICPDMPAPQKVFRSFSIIPGGRPARLTFEVCPPASVPVWRCYVARLGAQSAKSRKNGSKSGSKSRFKCPKNAFKPSFAKLSATLWLNS
ncbi:hypothetical protein SBA5_540001 [Candidatus Sulfotelmatomonas gaucii]|uniref:Uncharacterized protein n=1 Tax=Candidatus Sulfuritelmatomonas gaucii TaxID=2043161 RepID=A0A2N9LSR0_9BACT|nr:hypothetical protein SBA5_540001 [Candidatus Sulfotelmatomonas gaucii]